MRAEDLVSFARAIDKRGENFAEDVDARLHFSIDHDEDHQQRLEVNYNGDLFRPYTLIDLDSKHHTALADAAEAINVIDAIRTGSATLIEGGLRYSGA